MLFDKQIVPNDHHHFAATKRTNCNTTFWMPMRHERLPQVRRRCSASRSPRPWYRCVADRARKMAGWRAASRRFRPAGPFRPADQETPGRSAGSSGPAPHWRAPGTVPTAQPPCCGPAASGEDHVSAVEHLRDPRPRRAARRNSGATRYRAVVHADGPPSTAR
jgi:hypothetical protein